MEGSGAVSSVPSALIRRGGGAPLDSSAVGYGTLQSWALESTSGTATIKCQSASGSRPEDRHAAASAALASAVTAVKNGIVRTNSRGNKPAPPSLEEYLQVRNHHSSLSINQLINTFIHSFIHSFIIHSSIHS